MPLPHFKGAGSRREEDGSVRRMCDLAGMLVNAEDCPVCQSEEACKALEGIRWLLEQPEGSLDLGALSAAILHHVALGLGEEKVAEP